VTCSSPLRAVVETRPAGGLARRQSDGLVGAEEIFALDDRECQRTHALRVPAGDAHACVALLAATAGAARAAAAVRAAHLVAAGRHAGRGEDAGCVLAHLVRRAVEIDCAAAGDGGADALPVRVAGVGGAEVAVVALGVGLTLVAPFVRHAVAVVIDPVAHLDLGGMDGTIAVQAVPAPEGAQLRHRLFAGAESIPIEIEVVTLTDGVVDSVAVAVRIARVADTVLVQVSLGGVGHRRAVVGAVGHAVVVDVVVTCVADAVPVRVDLVGVVDGRAVVGAVGHAVAVGIDVAGIAHAVAVQIALVGVGRERAVVDGVADAVVVVVVVAGIAHAVAVRVGLGGVRDGGAVVDGVGVPVAVDVEPEGDDRSRPLGHEGVGVGLAASGRQDEQKNDAVHGSTFLYLDDVRPGRGGPREKAHSRIETTMVLHNPHSESRNTTVVFTTQSGVHPPTTKSRLATSSFCTKSENYHSR